MLYVKVVTPLVLKRWVWPMIKCSHLTPQSIYSYIDDLVIANCLIDARSGCACFVTYFHLPFYCVSMLFAYFTHSRASTCCFDCLAFFSFAKWMDKNAWELPLAIYAFLVSNSIHATSQSLVKSDSNPLGEEHSEPSIHHRLKFPKPLCVFRSDRFIRFGHTEFIELI